MKFKLHNRVTIIGLITLSLLIPSNLEATQDYILKRDEKSIMIAVDRPSISGAVVNLPWVSNDEFLKLQEENGTDVLMAGYCVVLGNPSPSERANAHLAAKTIAGFILNPNQIFSYNNEIGPFDETKGYQAGSSFRGADVIKTIGGGVCKFATTLYNVSILANLDIIERYNHFMPVTYVPYGQDATVSYGSKDLKVKNNNDFPILIWAEGIENRLYVGLYGKAKPPHVEWKHKMLSTTDAPKNYKVNPSLQAGEERIIVQGLKGVAVESWLTITDSNGITKNKQLGVSRYYPMPYLIEKGQ